MYERFYELRERPFALSPDPEYLYPSRVHREALDYLRYGLESHAGFVVITGEIGSGKTTLLQTLLRGLDSQTTVGRIVNTILEPRELLETIMIDFGLDPAGKSKPIVLRDLAQFLVDQRLAGRLVLLVIDEAQNLSLAALEELRMLSNLETEKSKLLQIVLVGQPNLRDKLDSPELEQLRQRITVSYHLQPLDAAETERYVNHRLRRAAVGAPLEFPRDVTDVVHARSRGVPRIINVICDAALVFGYAEERRQIDMPLVREVLSELETTGVLPAPPAQAGTVAPAEAVVARSFSSASAADVARGFNPATATTPAAPADTLVSRSFASTPDTGLKPVEAGLKSVEAGLKSRPTSSLSTSSLPAAPSSASAYAPAAVDHEMLRRTAAVEQREQILRQRERELAEQRRVLSEEYRLLRAQRAAATAAAPLRMPVMAGAPAPARFGSARPESFWAWLKRIMLGHAHPAVEEN